MDRLQKITTCLDKPYPLALIMNKQFVKIGNYIINVNQIETIFKCPKGTVTITLAAMSTDLDDQAGADYITLEGEDAATVWAYFSSMMISHTLTKETIV